MRILIAGCCNAGKTTLSNMFNVITLHTDDVNDLEWSEQSEEVSGWFDDTDSWIIEGMTVPRALRKWLLRNEDLDCAPADILIWLNNPKQQLTDKQKDLSEGADKVMNEIFDDLIDRGVEIIHSYQKI